MDLELRTKVCGLIEAVIAADGVVVEAEREFLRSAIRRFKIEAASTEEERAIPMSDPGRTTATLRELSPDVAARVMALLVDAAVVDGRVEPEEHALLLASAAALGIEAVALEERIAQRLAASLSRNESGETA